MTASRLIHAATRPVARLALGLCLGALGGQTIFSQPAPVTYRTTNRWLLVVETTRAMQPRAEAVAQIAGNLVLSGMNGQLRPGDSLGLWTFNSSLHAGEFALQTWTPQNAKGIAENVALFLAHQKFEGRPGRDRVFPALNGVISNSEFITVILITGGGETFHGTPFDKAINSIHQKWQTDQEKVRQPFVTMLRAQHGRSTDFEVGRPPWPMEFPPLPPELLLTNLVVTAPPPPKPIVAPPVVIGSNIIVHGKKPEPVPEIISNLPPAVPPVFAPPTNLPASAERRTNLPIAGIISPATNLISTATNLETAAAELPPSFATNPPPAPATTAAPEPASRGNFFWIVGVSVVSAAAGLGWVLVRRSQSKPRVSLITRSLDRDKK